MNGSEEMAIAGSLEASTPPRDPQGRPLPGLRDRGMLAVLAIIALFLAIAWWRESGYQIADSVEYMERAHSLATLEPLIDNKAHRSFGFAGILLPVFAVANWLGVRDFTHVAQICQLVQLVLSLALVLLTARLTARVAGRATGYAAALLVGLNPTLLRWGIEPVSGVAAGVFIALGVATLFDRRTPRSGCIAGLWLGLGMLMAYQSFLVIGPIVLFVVVRDLRSARKHALGLVAGVTFCLLAQCLLDLFYYDKFGISVFTYLYENLVINLARVVQLAGQFLHLQPLYDLAAWMYNLGVRLPTADIQTQYQQDVMSHTSDIKQKQGLAWYYLNIAHGVPWGAVALLGVGTLRALWLKSWKLLLLVFVIVVNVLTTGLKGSKDFRLWLPFLSMIALLGGLGWSTVAGYIGASASKGFVGFVRVAIACAVLVFASIGGVRENWSINTRHFEAFWRAIDRVNGEATANYAHKPSPDGTSPAPFDRVGCAYHWSVFLRACKDVDLVKLPHHLDYWASYTEQERKEDIDTIASLDWFITHLPILTEFPELMTAVNRDFAVDAVYYDRVEFEGLGPIFVFKRRTGSRDDKTLFDVVTDKSVADYAHEHSIDLSRSVSFCRSAANAAKPTLRLIDWNYTMVPGDGHGWITYTWCGGPFDGTDFVFVDRLTSSQPINAWQNNHTPAYKMWPTSKWGANWIVRESYLVVGQTDPFRPDGLARFFGGEHRRGDLIPTTLWMDVARYDEASGAVLERLDSCDDGRLVRETALFGRPPRPRGACISVDGLTRIGEFWMPVHARAHWPDDGRPVPEEQ